MNKRNNKKVKTAVIYARTACKNQKGDSSMNRQVQAVRRFARRNGYAVVGEYIDNGHSGVMAKRPALKKFLADSEGAGWKTVLVKDTNRLARSDVLFRKIVRQLDRFGTKVIFTNSSDHYEPRTAGGCGDTRDLLR